MTETNIRLRRREPRDLVYIYHSHAVIPRNADISMGKGKRKGNEIEKKRNRNNGRYITPSSRFLSRESYLLVSSICRTLFHSAHRLFMFRRYSLSNFPSSHLNNFFDIMGSI